MRPVRLTSAEARGPGRRVLLPPRRALARPPRPAPPRPPDERHEHGRERARATRPAPPHPPPDGPAGDARPHHGRRAGAPRPADLRHARRPALRARRPRRRARPSSCSPTSSPACAVPVTSSPGRRRAGCRGTTEHPPRGPRRPVSRTPARCRWVISASASSSIRRRHDTSTHCSSWGTSAACAPSDRRRAGPHHTRGRRAAGIEAMAGRARGRTRRRPCSRAGGGRGEAAGAREPDGRRRRGCPPHDLTA